MNRWTVVLVLVAFGAGLWVHSLIQRSPKKNEITEASEALNSPKSQSTKSEALPSPVVEKFTNLFSSHQTSIADEFNACNKKKDKWWTNNIRSHIHFGFENQDKREADQDAVKERISRLAEQSKFWVGDASFSVNGSHLDVRVIARINIPEKYQMVFEDGRVTAVSDSGPTFQTEAFAFIDNTKSAPLFLNGINWNASRTDTDFALYADFIEDPALLANVGALVFYLPDSNASGEYFDMNSQSWTQTISFHWKAVNEEEYSSTEQEYQNRSSELRARMPASVD